MKIESLGEPCRNFNILGSTTIVDPVGGLEKVVLSNFAAGAVGNLILIDPRNGQGESIPLPGDAGAWAILNLGDERLLVGTCPGYGYLHCLDLATREWASAPGAWSHWAVQKIVTRPPSLASARSGGRTRGPAR